MTLAQYLWKSEFVPGRKYVGNILKQGEPCFQPSLTTCLFFILFLCQGVVLYAVPPCEGKPVSVGVLFSLLEAWAKEGSGCPSLVLTRRPGKMHFTSLGVPWIVNLNKAFWKKSSGEKSAVNWGAEGLNWEEHPFPSFAQVTDEPLQRSEKRVLPQSHQGTRVFCSIMNRPQAPAHVHRGQWAEGGRGSLAQGFLFPDFGTAQGCVPSHFAGVTPSWGWLSGPKYTLSLPLWEHS